jgi:uncharacterized protein (DUF433 family)
MPMAIYDEPSLLVVDDDGVMRVAQSRVTLDTLVFAFLEGATAEEIAQQYPSLDLAAIYGVIGYYLRHRSEVESYLRSREKLARSVRKSTELRYAPGGVRARLLDRRREKA